MSTTSGTALIRAERVTKRFGALVAVDRVDYSLYENEVAAIIGSNGSGKTTFFNVLTGYYPPDDGTVRYRGRDITRMTPQERTFQLTSTFDNLSVIDNLVLVFFRAHRRSSLAHLLVNRRRRYRDNEKIGAIVELFGLQPVLERPVTRLSLGEKRRLEIAMALLAEPRVLLLDEPLAGLSDSEIKAVLEVLRKRTDRQTILIVEHKVSHIKDFVQRLTVMHEGRIIADGGYEECLRNPEVRKSYWQIEVAADERAAAPS